MDSAALTLSEAELREIDERNAITELLFYASRGHVARMQSVIAIRGVKVNAPSCCDYDRRTPLHLAAAESKVSTAKWLLEQGCTVNPVDRFFRTPLEDALVGGHLEMQQLLISQGGKVFKRGVGFVECTSMDLSAWDDGSRGSASSAEDVFHLRSQTQRTSRDGLRSLSCHSSRGRRLPRRDSNLDFLQDTLQERSPELRSLYLEKLVGRGSFGRVYKAKWRGCTVAVKVLSHEGSKSAQVNALHEEVVSQHVSHPNVITTYKVHKVEHGIDSAQSSLDERASRAMSGLSMSGGRNLANPMADAVGLEVDKNAFAEVAAKACAFAKAREPATLDLGSEELTLDFTETGCMLRESASFSSQAYGQMDIAVYGRSQSVTSMASPFATAIDLAKAGHLPSLPASGPGLANKLLPPKPRGIDRRSATELLPSIYSGQQSLLNHHSSLWPKELDQALHNNCAVHSPPSDPDSQITSFQLEGETPAETLILMEYADIGSLDNHAVRSRFKRNLVSCLLCLSDIAQGMKYLHSLGLLHSDLKGANVLLKSVVPSPLDPRGLTCKIADFGMSRVLGDDKTHVSTDTHGTVAYMAPEVLQTGSLSMSADVYSFAMIMLELWTGESIYKDFPQHQVLFKVFSGLKPDVPEDMPAEYLALVEECWAKDPVKRPSFKAILTRLQTLLDDALRL